MSKIRSIKLRYLISGLSICLSTLLIVSIISYLFSYNITAQQSNSRLQEKAMRNAAELDTWFRQYGTIVNDLAEEVETTGIDPSADKETSKKLIAKVKRYDSTVLDFYIGFEDQKRGLISGTEWVPDASYDCRTRGWYIEAQKNNTETVYTEPYVDAMTGKIVITIAKAVNDSKSGKVIGVMCADIIMDHVIDAVKSSNIGEGCYSFLLDEKGDILTHANKDYLPTNNGLTNISDINVPDYKKISNSLSNKSLNSFEATDFDGNKKYFLLSKISSTNWVFGIAVDQETYKKPLNSLLLGFLIAFLISIVAGVGIIIKFITDMVRPIKALNNTVKNFSADNMDVRSNLALRDELGELSNSFNQMADTIQEYSTDLENKVAERTKELKEKNEQIIESINYSERLQRAILPDLSTNLGLDQENYFTVWKPRDIVGGDFYWCKGNDRYSLLVVADCTGHGVPGALMTMSLSTILDSYSDNIGNRKPSEVLYEVNTKLKQILGQNKADSIANDGADAAVCLIDKTDRKVTFSGAKLSLFINDGSTIVEYKGTKSSIGYSNYREPFFEDIEIPYDKNMVFYITTDGLLDQNSEIGGGGLARAGFIRMLDNIKAKPLSEQKTELENHLKKCLSNVEQRDDITVVAFNCSRL